MGWRVILLAMAAQGICPDITTSLVLRDGDWSGSTIGRTSRTHTVSQLFSGVLLPKNFFHNSSASITQNIKKSPFEDYLHAEL